MDPATWPLLLMKPRSHPRPLPAEALRARGFSVDIIIRSSYPRVAKGGQPFGAIMDR